MNTQSPAHPLGKWNRAPGLLLAILVGLGSAQACHDDGGVGFEGEVVGGSCARHEHCAERCLASDDYPDGTCTVDCRDDLDCPEGTACVDREGGVCLLMCGSWEDCRAGYDCEEKERKGSKGDVYICMDD